MVNGYIDSSFPVGVLYFTSPLTVGDFVYVSSPNSLGNVNPLSYDSITGEVSYSEDLWMNFGVSKGIRESHFGFLASYNVMQLGQVGLQRAISLGVDLTGNPSGSFSGNEIVIPNNIAVIAPNAANNDYLGVLKVGSDNLIYIGGVNYTVSGTIVIDNVNGILFSNADIYLNTVGKGIRIKEGSNATMGITTLVGGTVTVSTTKITASSRVFLTGQDSSGTHGELTVSARTAGTSFTITSTSGTDTRSIAWIIIDPV